MNKKIIEIATREFKEKDRGLFITFMQLRFPNEDFESYIMEWVGRFQTGNPENYMDSISRSCYEQALKEVKK